ncbi:biotin transporter BioY [Clostridium gasigenes]|uniref:Biotin transporter n=1 Tax=Clostridium gasigenes TaxID=94869 RepID=A0A7X0VSF5_9CLOT|nr:biotin transporter BioY [Clostridium gasigenes]MBB6716444.1 biotin transporter BioY [Clostridium gasigenes]
MNLKSRDLVLISMFAALTAVGAFIRIPLPIVPFTLQYFFCALGAILLGAKRGAIAQILYVAIGLIGIPVFTQGGGPQYIFKPTFGYLLGFIVGAYIIGIISEKLKYVTVKNIFIACVCGLGAIYVLGLIYMYIVMNFYLGKAYSVWKVVAIGFLPFIGGDLVLTLLISLVGVRVIPILNKLGLMD